MPYFRVRCKSWLKFSYVIGVKSVVLKKCVAVHTSDAESIRVYASVLCKMVIELKAYFLLQSSNVIQRGGLYYKKKHKLGYNMMFRNQ